MLTGYVYSENENIINKCDVWIEIKYNREEKGEQDEKLEFMAP